MGEAATDKEKWLEQNTFRCEARNSRFTVQTCRQLRQEGRDLCLACEQWKTLSVPAPAPAPDRPSSKPPSLKRTIQSIHRGESMTEENVTQEQSATERPEKPVCKVCKRPDRKVRARGLCNTCYSRALREGTIKTDSKYRGKKSKKKKDNQDNPPAPVLTKKPQQDEHVLVLRFEGNNDRFLLEDFKRLAKIDRRTPEDEMLCLIEHVVDRGHRVGLIAKEPRF